VTEIIVPVDPSWCPVYKSVKI